MQNQNIYASPDSWSLAAEASTDERSRFITKTYLHLLGAVLAFTGLLFAYFQTELPQLAYSFMLGGKIGMFLVLGAYIGASMLAQTMALRSTNLAAQYFGLALYVVIKSLIFLPLLYVCVLAQERFGPIIMPAAVFTLGLFAVLTAIVFITRKDFSFMRSFLMFATFAALGLIICSMIFGFSLGLVFSFAMAALMCGYILYDTSNVLHHYHTNQYVAASLALFASLATLFWYILRIVLSMSSDD